MNGKIQVDLFRSSLANLIAQADDIQGLVIELERNEVFKAYELSITKRKTSLSGIVQNWIEQSEHVMKMFNEIVETVKDTDAD